MSVSFNADVSFSSKLELLDLQDCPTTGGSSLYTPSPMDSYMGSLEPRSPASPPPGPLCRIKTGLHEGTPAGSVLSTDPEQRCGWGPVTPKALQVFNSPRWVLFFLCMASFLQGMIINGFINTVVTSIERRFNLRSYQAGLIVSSYDIAACVCLVFVSYLGGRGHKPHWLGWGVLVMGLGSLVFALPHLAAPPYQVNMPEGTGMCSANGTSPCQDQETGGLSSYRYVFMLGQFLHGMGSTPLYTLGVTYLDENVNSDYSPVYIGIFYTAAILGPAAGYLFGGYSLTIFTDIHLTTEMTPDNPLWVGAWWIGFLIGGAAALLVAFPILGYPRQLPGSQDFAVKRVSEAHQLKDGSHASAADPQFGRSLKDMPRSMLLLLKNPTFIFLCLVGATEATLIASMATFGPKFLESQFSLSASEAATMFGYMVVPAGGGGTFLGGYLVKRFNLRCRGIIRFCMMCTSISLLATFVFLIQCPDVPMAGVTAPYQPGLTGRYLDNSSSLQVNLTVGCNAGCHCVRDSYEPVCGANGVMYYSPCHAGCSSVNGSRHSGREEYSGCRCVGGNGSTEGEGFALPGKCSTSCPHIPVLLSFLFIIISFTFLASIPALTVTLRCVPDSQKSFALGIQWILVRAIGSIPGPIAFGSLIDNSCILWQDKCGEQGSCYLYRNSAMSWYTMAAGVIYKVMGLVFLWLASVSYRPPPESPQSSCESTDHGGRDGSDLPIKDLPVDGVIVNPHASL
ncbi:solute carrier organic anion transporter family member 4A1 [Antennarius striatus]|uniref:solute carrier organic anion transporter family member 4A1 n=1 Tax=Antennarius striatus TaxID=241820 RepID=UPI0035B1D6BB